MSMTAIWSLVPASKWCHLLADDTDELHRFAALLGIKRRSFQGAPKTATPHYDLTGYERVESDRARRHSRAIVSRSSSFVVRLRALAGA